tara:strand:- start:531 stop:710 length:180 start_codon:yes stop_codon:yes gene_type:complete
MIVPPIVKLPAKTPNANNEQIILPTILRPFSAATEENLAATQIENIVNIKNPAFAILAV